MIEKITRFFKDLNKQQSQDNLSVEIATAVLLFEVMKADQEHSDHERAQIVAILSHQFSLTEPQVDNIIELAEKESEHAHDYFRFTSKINHHFPLSKRILMVERLWQLAYADGKLDVIEEHTIRRIADLLHLRHDEFIQCKLKVQDQHNSR
ncbi:TerB family tellurite resistance protein [Thalassotalea aquiviva]|uniref:tellurite resistance TerB family protein n=1 Tax=Thalassotalea aquiviva TaxID=3242415 RepID=UPI00352B1A11